MANQRRSLSWLSLSSVRRPTTTITATKPVTATAPPPARSDPIRPPTFKPFRLPAPAQPQKPTSQPTAIATTTTTTTAQQNTQPPPAPTHVQPPAHKLFRTATTKPAAPHSAPPPPQPQPPVRPQFRAPVSQPISNAKAPTTTTPTPPKPQPPVRPQFRAPVSQPISNAKAPTTTTPTPPKPQPLAITTKLSSPAHTPKPSTILPHSTTSSVPPSPEIKSPPAEHKGVPVAPNYTNPSHVDTKHHKIQSTTQIAKAGLAIQDKTLAMQRKYLEPKKFGMRVVRLVGDNIGAAMVLNSSRKKHDYGAKPLTIQDKTLQSSKETSTSTLFLNSNVQGVNNSIAFDSCLTHNDPGLHVRTLE